MLSIRTYFFKDRTVLATLTLMLIAIVGSWLFIVAIPQPPPDDPFVIVHSTIYFGIQRLGAWSTLFWFPGVGSAVLIFQTLVAYILYERDRFLSYTLMISGALAQIFLFVVCLFLLTMNT